MNLRRSISSSRLVIVVIGFAAVYATFFAAQNPLWSASYLTYSLQDNNRPTKAPDRTKSHAVSTAAEARTRAKLLHESFHGTLQVVHRDFFRKDESTSIPSRSLEDVFKELKQSHGVKLRWISVDLEPMNIDNEPSTPFEKRAAAALRTGKKEFERVDKGEFHYAARIKLSGTCLSCHAPRRKNNDDRFAGLVISLPLKTK